MLSLYFKVFFILLLSCNNVVVSYKILFVNHMPVKSHYNLVKAAADILHKRGHEITFVTGLASTKLPYREILLPELLKLKIDDNINNDVQEQSKFNLVTQLVDFIPKVLEATLANGDVQNLLKDKREKFDLVMMEYFMNEAHYGFAVKYECPMILLSTLSMVQILARSTGNPTSPEMVPNIVTSLTPNMNLLQRTYNTIIGLGQELIYWLLLNSKQEDIYKRFFPEEAAKVKYSSLHKKISLVLINSHPSLGSVRPLLPNAVEIGGYHIGDIEPLNKEYSDILDNAKNGVIFFSMGSNLNGSTISPEARVSIMKSLAKLKQKVLWKFETDLPGKPDNVIIKKWMPQPSILNHPNVRLFISHGGLLSITEATAAGVPLLAMPIFGDQFHNAKILNDRGNGLLLAFSNVSETSLLWALDEILGNPKYKLKADEMKNIYHDRPISPRDVVSFYAEHIIRTGGAKHLSPPDLSYISALLIDVALLIILPPLVLLLVSIYYCRKCFEKKQTTKRKKKKN